MKGGFGPFNNMFDFASIFATQLSETKPLTKGSINSILSLMSFNSTPRELVRESKALKEKIGRIKLLYYVVVVEGDSPSKPELRKTWDDEFTDLQKSLSGFTHDGYEGQIPIFKVVR